MRVSDDIVDMRRNPSGIFASAPTEIFFGFPTSSHEDDNVFFALSASSCETSEGAANMESEIFVAAIVRIDQLLMLNVSIQKDPKKWVG
jgi:hypothetical protein